MSLLFSLLMVRRTPVAQPNRPTLSLPAALPICRGIAIRRDRPADDGAVKARRACGVQKARSGGDRARIGPADLLVGGLVEAAQARARDELVRSEDTRLNSSH